MADLRRILSKPREIEAATVGQQDDFLRLVGTMPSKGVTFYVDGEPFAAGGVTVRAGGAYGALWFIAQDTLHQHVLTVVRAVKQHLAAARATGLPMRADIQPGNETTERFVQFLGFKKVPNTNYWELA